MARAYLTMPRVDEGGSEGSTNDHKMFQFILSGDESESTDAVTFDVLEVPPELLDDWIEDEQSVKLDDFPRVDDLDDVTASSMAAGRSSLGKKKWKKVLKESIDDLKSYDELQDFVLSTKNVNTTKKTRQVVNAFQRWLSKTCNEERPIETIDGPELDGFLSNYLMMKRKGDGSEHEPDTLTSIHRGILRHLKEKKYCYDPLKDVAFEMSREILASKRMKLKQGGKGNRPNKAEPLDDEEINHLWEKGALGSSTPRILQETIYFFFNMGFGQRGSHEAKQMCWGDVEVNVESDGTTYLEFTERVSKTRRGHAGADPRPFPPKIYETNDTRCPIKHFKMYTQRRPDEMLVDEAPFYLTVHPTATIREDIGFTCSPMGINTLNEIVKKVCQKGGLAGKKTNHSLRKTALQNLIGNNVPPTIVAQLSGHKNVASLNNYTTATRTQQRAMSNILTGAKRRIDALPCPTAQGCPPTKVQYSSESNSASMAVSIPGPEQDEASDKSTTQLLTAPTQVSTVNKNSTIERLAQSTSGMFAHANVHGSINVTINYNVSSHASSSVNVSPVIPQIKDV